MPSTPRPIVPAATPLHAALAGCEPLQRLQQQLAATAARMEAVRPLLPPGLSDCVRAGPLDQETWTLLASHAAAAAKLRQTLPRLAAELQRRGLEPSRLRVRILSGVSR
jgi:hypothetical protein